MLFPTDEPLLQPRRRTTTDRDTKEREHNKLHQDGEKRREGQQATRTPTATGQKPSAHPKTDPNGPMTVRVGRGHRTPAGHTIIRARHKGCSEKRHTTKPRYGGSGWIENRSVPQPGISEFCFYPGPVLAIHAAVEAGRQSAPPREPARAGQHHNASAANRARNPMGRRSRYRHPALRPGHMRHASTRRAPESPATRALMNAAQAPTVTT